MDLENIFNMFQNLQDFTLKISEILNINISTVLELTIGKIPAIGDLIVWIVDKIPGLKNATLIQFLIGSSITTILSLNIYKFFRDTAL